MISGASASADAMRGAARDDATMLKAAASLTREHSEAIAGLRKSVAGDDTALRMQRGGVGFYPVSNFIPAFADTRVYKSGSALNPITEPTMEPVWVGQATPPRMA